MADPSGKAVSPRPARSVRYRLLAIALLPTLVILPLLLGFAVYRWNAKFDAALTYLVFDYFLFFFYLIEEIIGK